MLSGLSHIDSGSAKMRQMCLAISEKNEFHAKIASKSANLIKWPKVCYYEAVLSLMIRSDKHAVVISRTDFAW